MQLFTGQVAFAADPQPYEGTYGPRFSIKVQLDPGQVVPPRCRTDAQGRVSVFVKPNDAETPYLRSLQRDDRVTLSWDEANSKKSSMDLVVPAGYVVTAALPPLPPQVQQPPPTYQQQAAPTGKAADTGAVWYPPTDSERDVKVAIGREVIKLQLELMNEAQVEAVKAGFPDLTPDVIQDLAATGLIQAERTYRPGMVAYKPAVLDEIETAFLSGVDDTSEETLVASVLDGIAKAVGKDRRAITELLSSFGLRRDSLSGGQDNQLFLLSVARAYYTELAASNEADTRRKIEKEFNLTGSLF